MAKKINKLRQFWSSYVNTCIGKGAQTELERLNRKYELHRAKNSSEKPEQQKTTNWRNLLKSNRKVI